METRYLYVPGFEKWQHYKDRTPPWIKMHRDLLHDYEFSRLPDDAKGHLILIWILASQMDNKIPHAPEFIQHKIGAQKKPNLDLLVSHGFLSFLADCKQVASNTLADCKQVAIGETETETETEVSSLRSDTTGARSFPDWLNVEAWEAWREMRKRTKHELSPHAEKLALGKLDKFRAKGHDPTEILNQSTFNDWKDLYEPKENQHGNNQRSNWKKPANGHIPTKDDRARAAVLRAAAAGGFAPEG